MAGGVVAPVLPDMIQQLGLDPELAGNLVSMHCLTIALFSPPLGILADRIGQLRVLVPCLILYAVFGVVEALMSSFWPLLLMRGLLGAASGGIAAASMGMLSSMYEGEARSQAIGYATSMLTITGIAFPLLGGWVGAEDWRWAFCLYGVGLVLAVLASVTLQQQEHRGAGAIAADGQSLGRILGDRQTLRLLMTLGLSSIAMYAVVIYAPLYLRETIGADALTNGIVLAARAIGAAGISAFGASWLAKTIGADRATALGFGLMAATLITIPFLHQLSWILLTAVVFGIGFGLVLPSLYSTLANLAPPDQRSTVLAAGTGIGFLGQFFSPVVLGPVLGFAGLEGVFYAAAGVAMAAGLLLFAPIR